MGILNLTPDSFFDGNKYLSDHDYINRVGEMIEQGAEIIDIGAVSTRPGSSSISEEEEVERLFPAVNRILNQYAGQAIFSIDTSNSKVAQMCFDAGINILNDICGGTNSQLLSLCASYNAPIIIMHMQGNPKEMQVNPQYEDVVSDLIEFFSKQIENAKSHQVHDIIIDPGFGFGKTLENNFNLLKSLRVFTVLEKPILVGVSRKSMICKALNIKPDNALNGTTALHMSALMSGAKLLRAHDVKEAKEVIDLYVKMQQS